MCACGIQMWVTVCACMCVYVHILCGSVCVCDVNIWLYTCMEAFRAQKERPKEVVKNWGLIYHFSKEWFICGEVTTKENGFGFPGVVNCGKVTLWGKLLEDTVILVRFICADPSLRWLCASSDNACPLFLVWKIGEEAAFTMGNLHPAFRPKEDRQKIPLCLFFLSYLQLSVIFMPNWYIWEWHSLISFIIIMHPRSTYVGLKSSLYIWAKVIPLFIKNIQRSDLQMICTEVTSGKMNFLKWIICYNPVFPLKFNSEGQSLPSCPSPW